MDRFTQLHWTWIPLNFGWWSRSNNFLKDYLIYNYIHMGKWNEMKYICKLWTHNMTVWHTRSADIWPYGSYIYQFIHCFVHHWLDLITLFDLLSSLPPKMLKYTVTNWKGFWLFWLIFQIILRHHDGFFLVIILWVWKPCCKSQI